MTPAASECFKAEVAMRVLVVDETAKDKAAQVMMYAREHIFCPGEDDQAPGDNFVCHLNTYRCVFMYTKSPSTGVLYRHLSISVPSHGFPSPESVSAIAGLFEFSNADLGIERQLRDGKWIMHIEEREPLCIVLMEDLPDECNPELDEKIKFVRKR
jgi:hypothetical protein